MSAPASPSALEWPLALAFLVATAATLGALFVGEIMGQAPCHLCWYQRVAMFPLPLLLAIALWRGDGAVRVYALPLAGLGGLVAGFHSLLHAGLVPERIEPCGPGPSCAGADMTILGALPLPFLALAAFVAVAVLLLLPAKANSR